MEGHKRTNQTENGRRSKDALYRDWNEMKGRRT